MAAPRKAGNKSWTSILTLGVAAALWAAAPGAAATNTVQAQTGADVAVQSPPAPATLQGLLDEVLADPVLARARVGVAVVDLDSGRTVYRRGAEQPLNPASNVKLVTTAAALALLGPEYRYTTALYHGRDALESGVIDGDVYLRGGGDPDLVTSDLYELASDLRARGITRITGGVVVDAGAFDRDELPPGFDQKSEMASYRAPSGAASINHNTIVLRVRPGDAVGTPVVARLQPPVPSVVLTVKATTATGHGNALRADVVHEDGTTKIELSGTFGVAGGSSTFSYPIASPARYTGDVLALVLQQAGVKLGRKRVRIGSLPAGARMVGAHHSAPLSVLVRSVNKFSNNFMAEQILKTIDLGDDAATFPAALSAVRAHVQSLGIADDGLSLGNGSGLYDNNRLSADQLVQLLGATYRDFRHRADFLASLAVMGVDGTTKSRLQGGTAERWVRGKTGTLDGISCFSGYAGAAGRAPLAFSILMNDLPPGSKTQARRLQNRIIELLARSVAGVPLTDPVAADDAEAADGA